MRFGADGFGTPPADGTLFHCTYRTGPGSLANVAADTIVHFKHPVTGECDVPVQPVTLIPYLRVTNPLPVIDGVDPESLAEVRQLAPEEFRAITFRAVAPVDYCNIAGFVTPDPVDAHAITSAQRTELTDLMNCVRQAGRDVHVLAPRFRAVDLEITVCVKPGFLPSDVRDRVLLRLRGDATTQGFFGVDSFTFGMPLHRLTLEAAIGSVPGVLGVPRIRIAARGFHLPRNLEPVYRVPDNQILRLANDPRTPERGSIKVYTEGGV